MVFETRSVAKTCRLFIVSALDRLHKNFLSENPADHLRTGVLDHGQLLSADFEFQSLGIESKPVQDRGQPIVVRDDVLDGIMRKIVSRTMHIATLDPSSSDPHAEPISIVVATNVF